MRQVPDCLQRRYKAMDELITDLGSVISNQSSSEYAGYPNNDDRGIKLMCKFWNILKEDPNCDLKQAVEQKMAMNTRGSGMFGPRDITCYQTGKDDSPKSPIKCGKDSCAKTMDPTSKASGTSCCNREQQSKAPMSPKPSNLCAKHEAAAALTTPLTQVLGNMKEAASAEKKCFEKTAELRKVQEQLKVQVAMLEEREQDEVALMKEADAMWAAMESEYKQKLEASKQRQEELLGQQKEVEANLTKWRKNKKNLEEQMTNVDKCIQEMREKYKKRTNDLKAIEAEMVDMTKRIEGNTKELANASNTIEAKKQAFEQRMEKLSKESNKLQINKSKEEAFKKEKIAKGNECVKEAREELAKLCRVLLKKKLENEDLRAEAKALMEEIDLLRTTCDQCGEKCKNKEQSLISEIAKCKAEIEQFQLRCTKCHVSCDTKNLRKYCTDCPRCQEEMDPCVYGGEKCTELAMNECVCMDIKHKFMNNVFENMYIVLERQINTKPGKAVAEQVLKCLKGSTNGKLDGETRKKLQNFILAAVKTNLNLTIIGGAVKTRCEMDPDTYKEMLLCLSKVKAEKSQKVDKGTDSRKEPCARWGGTNECNCPKGPKNCICKRKAPPPPSDPAPCGQLDEDKKDVGELSICPHKEKTPCGPLCGNVPTSDIATKLSKTWKPAPCAEKSCTFKSSNVKSARCMMGNTFNSRATGTKGHKTNAPIIVVPSDFESLSPVLPCDCDGEYNSCGCYGSSKNYGLEKVIMPSEAEFKEMFKQKHTTLPVTVMGQNGAQADMNAELTKTNSGHMALDVRRISHVGDIASDMEEYPVSLFKTSSSYKLIVGQHNAKPNAVLKRRAPGVMNVVLKNGCISTDNKTGTLNPQDELFRVKVKDMEDPGCLYIRRTGSGNYEFVLEKEFEKRYKQVVNDSLDDNCACAVNLSKTMSGTRVIDFEEGCNCWQNYHNALLTKSETGNVKLIVQGVDFKALKENNLFSKYRSVFENLYNQLAICAAKNRKIQYPKYNSLERKLENGLLLGEKIRLKIQDQDHLVADLSIVLNKISSGQYSVTFNNRAAEPFIRNLLTSWLGLLPVLKISECNLTVDLSWGKELKHRFGWLLMSPNSKVIVVVDGKVTKGVQLDAYSVGCGYKECGITTTCNQKNDCSDCDQSNCICDLISRECNDWNFK